MNGRRPIAARLTIGLTIGVLTLSFARPLAAQVAFSATALSNYVYRGVTLSDGKPAVSLNIAYDHASGVYAGGSVIGANTAFDGVQGLGVVAYVGFAGRLKGGSVWDAGVIDTHVTNFYYGKYAYDLTEIYTGLRTKNLNYYLYFSPDYYGTGVNTLYAQVSGALHPIRGLRLFGHAGVLTALDGGGYPRPREQYDLELGVGTNLTLAHCSVAQIQLAWATRGPDATYLAGHAQNRSALTLSATHAF